MPKYPYITVKLVGEDGNAFNIIGRCLSEAKKGGVSFEERNTFSEEAMSGDYGNVLRTAMKWFNVE